jgi:HD-GYP domain-containing protein (c-di-GMP phosphodiesterase class II)
VQTIVHGALLHDIGKIAMPDAILKKRGPLTGDEWAVVKSHPRIGYEIVSACPALEMASEIVYSHQERFDGTGYPRGLKGMEICRGARVFTVIDAYDAMRTHRPYSPGMSMEKAIAEIVASRGKQFDPDVVDAFLRCQPQIEAHMTGREGAPRGNQP